MSSHGYNKVNAVFGISHNPYRTMTLTFDGWPWKIIGIIDHSQMFGNMCSKFDEITLDDFVSWCI